MPGAAHKFFEAGTDTKTFEKNSYAGGHTTSWTFDTGFIFDEGPHISFTQNEHVQKVLSDNIEGRFETIQAQVNNYFEGHWIKHPGAMQSCMVCLQELVIANCLLDFVKAQADNGAR